MFISIPYRNTPAITGIRELSNGYQIIPTVSGGLAQIQQRLMEALDKISNKLPLNPMIEQATSTLSESQRTMKNLQTKNARTSMKDNSSAS